MNYIDLLLIIPIALGAWKGFRKGLVIEVFSLLALFAGIYLAIHFSDYIANLLTDHVQLKSEYIPIAAFLLTFVAVLIGVHFLGKMIHSLVKMAALELFNKIFGAIFAALKGLLILCIVLLCFKALNTRFGLVPEKLLEESLLFEPLSSLPLVILPAIEDSPWYGKFEEWKNDQLEVR
ncbi:MAG: CvpA family protein [Flavobacteriales bacterium]|nr:CvpA family protein [Flavobacteriales bacterium]